MGRSHTDQASGDELLERAAADGTFDAAEWPRALETVFARLEHNVFTEFPTPSWNRSDDTRPSTDTRSSPAASSQEPARAGKEINGPPSSPPAAIPSQSSHLATSQSEHSPGPLANIPSSSSPSELPHELMTSYNYITNTLRTTFPTQPPHTIQRLSELVLYPRQHYRYLPSYLNALDRAVSVSSGSGLFPLPSLDPLSLVSTTIANGSLPNGDNSTSSPSPSPVSVNTFQDESLGGALLTPIPWLRANGGEISSSASGRGRSSSPLDAYVDGLATTSSPLSGSSSPSHEFAGGVTDGFGSGHVTQGELLRQEQTAASPPAPVSSLPSRAYLATASREEVEAVAGRREIGDEGIPLHGDDIDESEGHDSQGQPHARGPDIIGMEDTGKQPTHSGAGQVLDLEAAVGRASSSSEKHAKHVQEDMVDEDDVEEKSAKRKAEEDGGNDAQKVKTSDEISNVEGDRPSEKVGGTDHETEPE